jgi:predicted phage terminase large subunit-like protein
MTKKRDIVANELFIREAAQYDFLTFVKYTKLDFSINWHHRVLADKLQQFAEGKIKKLMIFMPPQTGKSEMSTRRLPSFILGKNPNTRIAVCAYNSPFARGFNRDIQRIITDQRYKNVFPNTSLNEKNVSTDAKGSYLKNADIFEIVGYKGYLMTVGIGGPLTGKTVDIGIIDDPIKDSMEANSKVYRDRLWDWYENVFKTRLHNNSQQLVTLTRWHEDDLAGRILAIDKEFEVLVLPAIKESDTNELDIRQIGEALWPEKHSLERYSEIRQNSPRTFTSLYQQRPAPIEGNIIKKEYLQIIDYEDVPDEVFDQTPHSTVDTAFGIKENNDPSGMLYYYKYDNCLYLFDYFEKRLEFPDLLKAIEQKAKTNLNSKSKIYVEPKASGKSVVQTMKRATTLNIVEYEMPSGSKLERITACLDVLSTKRVYLIKGHWNRSFIESCTVFPNGAHDEPVDTLGMAIHKEFLKEDRGRRSVTTVLGSYRPY